MDLSNAIKVNDLALINKLISNGINPNIPSGSEYPLFLSIGSYNGQIFDLLLNHPSIDLSVKDIYGRNALNWAIIYGKEQIFSKIINLMPSLVNNYDVTHRSIIRYILVNRQYQLLDIVCSHLKFIDMDDVLYAIEKIEDNDVLRKLLSLTNDIYSMLSCAIDHHNHEAFDLIVELYSDKVKDVINYSDYQHYGFTLFHRMIYDEHVDMIEKMLKLGVNPNIANMNGDTPLHTAASLGYNQIVELLVKYEANINIKNNNGDTPIDLAVEEGHDDIAQYLRENRYPPDVKQPE